MLDKNAMISMYLKAGFSMAQAELLHDLFLSIIVTTKKVVGDLVKQEVADKLSSNLRSKN